MELDKKYSEIHSASAEAVRRGNYRPDAVPVTGDSRWGLSLVALPTSDIARKLAATASELNDVAANPHVAYRPDDIHITVRSLEGHERTMSEKTVANYQTRIEKAIAGFDELHIELRGLAVTRGGVIACGYANKTLSTMRSELLLDWLTLGFESMPGGDGERVRDTSHASLVVFRESGKAEETLVDRVENFPSSLVGVVKTRSLALVSYEVIDESITLHRQASISW